MPPGLGQGLASVASTREARFMRALAPPPSRPAAGDGRQTSGAALGGQFFSDGSKLRFLSLEDAPQLRVERQAVVPLAAEPMGAHLAHTLRSISITAARPAGVSSAMSGKSDRGAALGEPLHRLGTVIGAGGGANHAGHVRLTGQIFSKPVMPFLGTNKPKMRRIVGYKGMPTYGNGHVHARSTPRRARPRRMVA